MEEETIIKKGAANWQDGIQAKGGHLILTNKSIYFEAHKINIGRKQNEILLKDIQDVKTHFLNSLVITASNGKIYTYIVNGRKKWESAIRDTIARG